MAKRFSETSFIQFVGWQEEDFWSRDKAFNATMNTYFKLHEIIKHPINMYIHIKTHNDEFGKKKYSIRARLNSPGIFFEAKSTKWDFINAIQDAMHTLEREAIDKLK